MINLYWFVSTLCDWSCWRNIAWPNVFLYSLSRKLRASPNMCHFQMRSCMENCAISRREIVKNTLYIQETIPYRTETRKKWILRYWFSGFSSKNKHDPIINNTKVFFYVHSLVDVVATARSSDAQCSVALLENKRRRIRWEDNWF